MLVSIIWFLIIIGILITSHEFGHYIIGVLNGIRVKEFMVGVGPAIFKKKKGDTLYSVRLLPFGGACVFDGMDELDVGDETEKIERDEHSFPNVNVWKRIATIFAGPFANFLLAFLLSLILVAVCGTDLPTIGSVMEGSAAEEVGLQAGDRIYLMDGERIHLYREISINSFLYDSGKPLTIGYIRDGKKYKVTLTPRYSEEDQRYYMGIIGGNDILECNALQVFQYSFYEVEYWTKYTFKSLMKLVTGKLGVDALSGPVGVADFVGETYEEVKPYGLSSVILTMMNLIVLLSVNLGIMNLLPIPALDGGRLLFMLVEVVRGKPIPPEKEGLVHLAGIIFFIVLMVIVMYHDIMRLIG